MLIKISCFSLCFTISHKVFLCLILCFTLSSHFLSLFLSLSLPFYSVFSLVSFCFPPHCLSPCLLLSTLTDTLCLFFSFCSVISLLPTVFLSLYLRLFYLSCLLLPHLTLSYLTLCLFQSNLTVSLTTLFPSTFLSLLSHSLSLFLFLFASF